MVMVPVVAGEWGGGGSGGFKDSGCSGDGGSWKRE